AVHTVFVAVGPRQARLQRTALDVGSDEVLQILYALHHRGNTTGIEEVLHQETAGGFQVDKAWNARAQPVPVIQGQRHAEAAGQRQQMDDGIGGTADGAVDHDRVLERGTGQDTRDGHAATHE